jgi:hypothetical protein
MSFLAQHNEIRARLESIWGNTTPVSWPNKTFVPPNPQVPWIALSIKDGDSGQIGMGALPATTRYAGVIWIQVFVSLDDGDPVILGLADQAKAVFHNWCGVSVRCWQGKIHTVGNDGNGWYQINVSIPFQRDEQN